jgi:hypothetical protein
VRVWEGEDISVRCLLGRLARCVLGSFDIQGVTGRTDQTSGGCSLC